MNKRIITIIITLLAIFLIIIGGMWLVGRHTATKNGKAPLTFRQFLGLSAPASPASGQGQGTLGSIFKNSPPGSQNAPTGGSGTPGTGPSNGSSGNGSTPILSGGTAGAQGTVQSSHFTNDTISPSGEGIGGGGTIGTGGSIGSGGSVGTSGGFTTGGGFSSGGVGSGSGGVGGGGSGGSTGGTLSSCTAADTNISFTPEEIQQLNALQAQFNTLNANLATNDAVAAELKAYNSYKLEEGRIAEMQSFCQATAPLLTNPALQRHVPTPFWHDSTQDAETYTAGTVHYAADGTIPASGASFLERILRISLW